jgi:hypothetical protein
VSGGFRKMGGNGVKGNAKKINNGKWGKNWGTNNSSRVKKNWIEFKGVHFQRRAGGNSFRTEMRPPQNATEKETAIVQNSTKCQYLCCDLATFLQIRIRLPGFIRILIRFRIRILLYKAHMLSFTLPVSHWWWCRRHTYFHIVWGRTSKDFKEVI